MGVTICSPSGTIGILVFKRMLRWIGQVGMWSSSMAHGPSYGVSISPSVTLLAEVRSASPKRSCCCWDERSSLVWKQRASLSWLSYWPLVRLRFSVVFATSAGTSEEEMRGEDEIIFLDVLVVDRVLSLHWGLAAVERSSQEAGFYFRNLK